MIAYYLLSVTLFSHRGIVAAAIVVYFVFAELYKMLRRIPKRDQYRKQQQALHGANGADMEAQEGQDWREVRLADTVAIS